MHILYIRDGSAFNGQQSGRTKIHLGNLIFVFALLYCPFVCRSFHTGFMARTSGHSIGVHVLRIVSSSLLFPIYGEIHLVKMTWKRQTRTGMRLTTFNNNIPYAMLWKISNTVSIYIWLCSSIDNTYTYRFNAIDFNRSERYDRWVNDVPTKLFSFYFSVLWQNGAR